MGKVGVADLEGVWEVKRRKDLLGKVISDDLMKNKPKTHIFSIFSAQIT